MMSDSDMCGENGSKSTGTTSGRRRRRKKTVVVAVDSDRQASQHALKWAADRILHQDDSLVLLHVRHFNPHITSFETGHVTAEREPDGQETEMLRPFRGFCAHRQIKFEIVVVEDDDVAQALIDYAIRHRIENFLLGASSRSGFSRLFKPGYGISGTVLKWIPNFCNVYVISKAGKLAYAKSASSFDTPPPQTHPYHQKGVPRCRAHSWSESDVSALNSLTPDHETDLLFSSPSTVCLSCRDDMSSSHERRRTPLSLTRKLESMEESMERLRAEDGDVRPRLQRSETELI